MLATLLLALAALGYADREWVPPTPMTKQEAAVFWCRLTAPSDLPDWCYGVPNKEPGSW